MSDQVIVIKSSSGAYYILGAEVLESTKVRTEEHVSLLADLTSGKPSNAIGAIKGVTFFSLGDLEAKDDRFLMLEYVSPKYQKLGNHSMPS